MPDITGEHQMNQQAVVIEPQGQLIGKGQATAMCGENLPIAIGARSSNTALSGPVSWKRGLTIESAEDVCEQHRLAHDAAMAIHEWSEAAMTARRAQGVVMLDQVRGFVDRITAGIPAWVLLDVNKPRKRTIEEYAANIRDFLIYLALNDLSPAEVGPEDVKAFKVFLQSNGAVDEMERLRARWYGRAQRVLYRMDSRDVVMCGCWRWARPGRDRAKDSRVG